MRKMEKGKALKLLGSMVDAVGKLPDEVRIGRLFIADDGQGLILEQGIETAAAVFGKTVEAEKWPNGWTILKFHVGELMVSQIKEGDWRGIGSEA